MREFIIQIFKIIINYRYYSIIIIVYELYFSFFYQNKYNKLSVSRYKSATNPIPTPFYLIKLIDAFIIKKKLNIFVIWVLVMVKIYTILVKKKI